MVSTVYKILDEKLWQKAREDGVFRGAGIDLADGYIHLSTAAQAVETARLYFAGVDNLVLVAVDAAALGTALRFEASRGGALFPHLYGDLPLDAVLWVKPLPRGADGAHVFPDEVARPEDGQ
ncbi:DUF952 domain-containing protein [Rhizobium sp. RU36D]|uniref:DUF952 domain-containing protein n=1 Tax=Rhizobium sp. RU36D TaxID=1907415 RepID=UPI0009D897E8|nr:DUF952 domain-containing protein [Rhizobium sp. RU36D]SMD18914.1 Uncharacterized conserved protein, DUF952 family [Rhizobium sp. RU36D]